jgi:competence protein ComEA
MKLNGLAAAVAAVLLAPAALAGPVNVNTADAKTIAKELSGIGLSKAQAIVAHREKNGPFKSAEDLAKVQGIGAKTVEKIKPDLRFDAAKPGG